MRCALAYYAQTNLIAMLAEPVPNSLLEVNLDTYKDHFSI